MEEQLKALGFPQTFIEPLNIGFETLKKVADDLFELAQLVYSKL